MVGSFLVDVARRDELNAGALQSLATAAKWTGALASQLVARSVPLLSPRAAIEVTALAPALLALVAFFLPDVRNSEPVQRVRSGPEAVFGCLALLILQGNLVLIGCQNLTYFMEEERWRTALIVTATCSLLFMLILFLHFSRRRQPILLTNSCGQHIEGVSFVSSGSSVSL